jgi:hypothetical protein
MLLWIGGQFSRDTMDSIADFRHLAEQSGCLRFGCDGPVMCHVLRSTPPGVARG